MVDLQFGKRVEHFVSLNILKAIKASIALEEDPAVPYLSQEQREAIADMPLITQGRLSVQPVSEMAFAAIEQMTNTGGWEATEAGPKKPRKRKVAKDADVGGEEPESTTAGEDSQTQDAETQEESEPKETSKTKRRKKTVEVDEPTPGTRRSARTRGREAS